MISMSESSSASGKDPGIELKVDGADSSFMDGRLYKEEANVVLEAWVDGLLRPKRRSKALYVLDEVELLAEEPDKPPETALESSACKRLASSASFCSDLIISSTCF
jgi:hypothetical protein